jgi:peptidoglycan-associated lipoprotein
MMQPGSTQVAAESYQMKNVYFAFDRYDLSEGSKRTLQKNAAWLEVNPGMTVRIEGHADERGTTQYNLSLAKSRAITAADYLESLGIVRERIETMSFGESSPLEVSHSEDAWAKNRRVEFNALGDEGKVRLLE